jgi:hypothetical protein
VSDPNLAEFETVQSQLRRSGYASWYERAAAKLDPERVDQLDAALASPHLTGRAISIVLKSWGIDVTPESVTRYRRRRDG